MNLNIWASYSKEGEKRKDEILMACGTSREKLERDLFALKNWISSQTHLPQSTDDATLECFILGTKNNQEETKRKLQNYFSRRLKLRSFIRNEDELNEQFFKNVKTMLYAPYPNLTEEGYRFHYVKLTEEICGKYYNISSLKMTAAYCQILSKYQPYITGGFFVIDTKHVTFQHVIKASFQAMREIMECTQDVFPSRVKGIILINCPPAAYYGMKILNPLLKKKMRKRFYIFKEDYHVLSQFVKPENLPKDYGGKYPSLQEVNDLWLKILMEELSWLVKENSGEPQGSSQKIEEIEEVKNFKNLNFD